MTMQIVGTQQGGQRGRIALKTNRRQEQIEANKRNWSGVEGNKGGRKQEQARLPGVP